MSTRTQEWVSAAIQLYPPNTLDQIKEKLQEEIAALNLRRTRVEIRGEGKDSYVNYEGPSQEPLRKVETMGHVTIGPKQRFSNPYF